MGRPCTLADFAEDSHATAKDKGWWDDRPDYGDRVQAIPEKIALMHSELSEALEEARAGNLNLYYGDANYAGDAGKPEGFGIELADCVIRIFDLCEALGIDIQQMIEIKMAYNETRPHRHGGKNF